MAGWGSWMFAPEGAAWESSYYPDCVDISRAHSSNRFSGLNSRPLLNWSSWKFLCILEPVYDDFSQQVVCTGTKKLNLLLDKLPVDRGVLLWLCWQGHGIEESWRRHNLETGCISTRPVTFRVWRVLEEASWILWFTGKNWQTLQELMSEQVVPSLTEHGMQFSCLFPRCKNLHLEEHSL